MGRESGTGPAATPTAPWTVREPARWLARCEDQHAPSTRIGESGAAGGASIVRVFISHSSKDMPAVEALARDLHEHGIETWLDRWTMGPGDNFVAKINEGLEQADAGLIVFSIHARESCWVKAEVDYLTYARIHENKV